MTVAEIVPLDASRLAALHGFLDRLPEYDRTFIKEDVHNHAVAERWVYDPGSARHWVAVRESAVCGLVLVVPLAGWSAHVGELRLVVDPELRGRGLGTAMARHALRSAAEMGLSKLVVEVVAEQQGAVSMFDALGFRGEALLSAYIRDRTGQLRDLLVLAHDVGEEWAAIASLGVPDDLAETG